VKRGPKGVPGHSELPSSDHGRMVAPAGGACGHVLLLGVVRGTRGHAGRRQTYRDYIAWLQHQDMKQPESFWRAELQGYTQPTLLARERPTATTLDEFRDSSNLGSPRHPAPNFVSRCGGHRAFPLSAPRSFSRYQHDLVLRHRRSCTKRGWQGRVAGSTSICGARP